MLVSEETEAKLVHEITAEAVANMQLPTITFVEEWRPLIDRVDPDEMSEDLAGLTTTVGVIAALLMSMMFGESGMELYANENSIWGERVDMMKHAYTVLCAVTTVICFAAVIISARLYMAMLVCPKRLTVAAVATMGGTIVLEPLFVSFLAISIMTTVVIGLNATIQLPGIGGLLTAIAIFLVFCAFLHTSRRIDNSVVGVIGKLVRGAELAQRQQYGGSPPSVAPAGATPLPAPGAVVCEAPAPAASPDATRKSEPS